MKKSEKIIFDYFTSDVRVEEILKSKKKIDTNQKQASFRYSTLKSRRQRILLLRI